MTDDTRMPNEINLSMIREFRANGGTVTAGGFGSRLILLHHIGAKTGQLRVTPLAAMPDGNAWVVVAAPNRAPQEPAWAANLRANPEVYLEAGPEIVTVTARRLDGDEYDTAFRAFTEYMADIGDPSNNPDWHFPFFRLERRD
jgi:deazaflavin-dependent oxidoreductase (nitroreductase family)